jgi:hypothetical protein
MKYIKLYEDINRQYDFLMELNIRISGYDEVIREFLDIMNSINISFSSLGNDMDYNIFFIKDSKRRGINNIIVRYDEIIHGGYYLVMNNYKGFDGYIRMEDFNNKYKYLKKINKYNI